MMDSLSKDGKYSFKVEANFTGEYATVEETFKAIKDLFEETHYVMDTHTAVAAGVYDKYKEATLHRLAIRHLMLLFQQLVHISLLRMF